PETGKTELNIIVDNRGVDNSGVSVPRNNTYCSGVFKGENIPLPVALSADLVMSALFQRKNNNFILLE
ncbi:hypothetical protein HPX83_005014, partial [Salmonella enterica]|nr:hypothetical protein [Salmonella enterica]